jgi:2-dehydropantoate 2-reductase
MAASMFRDIERRTPIEAEHIVGDLLRRGEVQGMTSPLLRIAYAHLKAYAARRARDGESQ